LSARAYCRFHHDLRQPVYFRSNVSRSGLYVGEHDGTECDLHVFQDCFLKELILESHFEVHGVPRPAEDVIGTRSDRFLRLTIGTIQEQGIIHAARDVHVHRGIFDCLPLLQHSHSQAQGIAICSVERRRHVHGELTETLTPIGLGRGEERRLCVARIHERRSHLPHHVHHVLDRLRCVATRRAQVNHKR